LRKTERWKKIGGNITSDNELPKGNVAYPHGIQGRQFIGNNVEINSTAFIDNTGDLRIGNDVIISSGAVIYTHKHYFPKSMTIAKARDLYGVIPVDLEIGDDVLIGTRSIVIAVHKIAKGTVLGAGSVLTKDIENEYEIWAGSPAKQIGVRE
jgi:acetyltransferase-like isoleucine patch superfamily enzyme